jgi:hypothetical protein
MHGYMHSRGCLPAALAGASFEEMQNDQNRTPRKEIAAQKNSTPYNLNRAAPCPVTITGICGHDAGICGHDQRNTHVHLRTVVISQALKLFHVNELHVAGFFAWTGEAALGGPGAGRHQSVWFRRFQNS